MTYDGGNRAARADPCAVPCEDDIRTVRAAGWRLRSYLRRSCKVSCFQSAQRRGGRARAMGCAMAALAKAMAMTFPILLETRCHVLAFCADFGVKGGGLAVARCRRRSQWAHMRLLIFKLLYQCISRLWTLVSAASVTISTHSIV